MTKKQIKTANRKKMAKKTRQEQMKAGKYGKHS